MRLSALGRTYAPTAHPESQAIMYNTRPLTLAHELTINAFHPPARLYKPPTSDIALAKSKSLLFSDSDSDSDNDGSSTGEVSRQAASSSFGDAESIAALSAVSKVFREGRDVNPTDDAAASSSSSPAVFHASRNTPATASKTMPPPPPPPAEVPDTAGAGVVDGSAATGAATQAVHGKSTVVEPSAAPRVSVQGLSSTSTSHTTAKAGPAAGLSATASAGGLGGARGRPSALGRPGMAPAKVSMPIVGGRAAWNKFLASTAPGESGSDVPGASTANASADSGGQGTGDGASAEGGSEDGDLTADAAAVEEQDEVLAARGPRGFKSAAESQEGPNKGPAGAFSGNAMWRLAAGASSAANRTRSGVAANGHGGYANPLAAMRAGGTGASGAGSGGGADGAAGGGAVANPLAGLRGAASMGGAGRANPLARGRGARPGGAGGVANPMLRGGVAGGTANPLARASTVSGGMLSSVPPGPGADEAPAMPSGGVTASAATNAEDEGDGEVAAVGAEGEASASEGGTKRAAIDGAIDLDRPTEFRAIGSNGSWQTGGRIPIPPRRPARAQPEVEADPGQAKVGGLVVSTASRVCFVLFFLCKRAPSVPEDGQNVACVAACALFVVPAAASGRAEDKTSCKPLGVLSTTLLIFFFAPSLPLFVELLLLSPRSTS